MRSSIVLAISIMAVLAACNGHRDPLSTGPEKAHAPLAAGDTVTELSSNIMLVHQDRKNTYWFGSHVDGIYRYDGTTLMQFTVTHGLPSNRVDEIKEDKHGNIYFTTSKGIVLFNGRDFTVLKETNADSTAWKLHPDDVWFKSPEYAGHVHRYDGKALYTLKMPSIKLGEDHIIRNPNTPNPYAVYNIYRDREGNIWFGTGALGVCRYNGRSFVWITEDDLTELHDGPANGVRSIIEDGNGDFWFNSAYRYTIRESHSPTTPDQVNAPFYKRTKSIGSLDGKSDGDLNEYLSITKDKNGALWIATYNAGVWKYDGVKLTHYPVQIKRKDISLFSIHTDNMGDLWLGTHESGALKFNGRGFEPFRM